MARKGRSKGQGTLYRRNGRGPWLASWYDHTGRRRENSTRTTDRAAAERILAKHVADTALRREGVIDPTRDRFMIEGRRPIREHIAAYIAHCEHVGQAPRHVAQKREHLARLIEVAGVTRLGELTTDALERRLVDMKSAGRSARSLNFARQIAVAFFGWCVRTGRAESSPLMTVPKQDEGRDRRRIRRALTNDELSRLLAVAREHGRDAWYLAALHAGLRRGDLQRLTWADVDFTNGTLRIRHGKAKREDIVPMHEQLAEALRARHTATRALPTARVFPQTVQNETRLLDFLRAGIARREAVTDGNGEPILVGSGIRARPLTRIVCEDDEGRVVDLHALRTTLGTQLARAGVAPQIAQRIMRHSDYRTTLRHYTVLGLDDTAKAVAQLPSVPTSGRAFELAAATGTEGFAGSLPVLDPQRFPQHTARETVQRNASPCDVVVGATPLERTAGPSGEPGGPASRRIGSPAQPCGLRASEPGRCARRTGKLAGRDEKQSARRSDRRADCVEKKSRPQRSFVLHGPERDARPVRTVAFENLRRRAATRPGKTSARRVRTQRADGHREEQCPQRSFPLRPTEPRDAADRTCILACILARIRAAGARASCPGNDISPPGGPSGLTGIEKSSPQRSLSCCTGSSRVDVRSDREKSDFLAGSRDFP